MSISVNPNVMNKPVGSQTDITADIEKNSAEKPVAELAEKPRVDIALLTRLITPLLPEEPVPEPPEAVPQPVPEQEPITESQLPNIITNTTENKPLAEQKLMPAVCDDLEKKTEAFARQLDESRPVPEPDDGSLRTQARTFARKATARTATFLIEHGGRKAAEKVEHSVLEAVISRISAPHRETAIREPSVRETTYPMKDLHMTDQLISDLRVFERRLISRPMKNEELLGFEIGVLSLKTQIICERIGELGGEVKRSVHNYIDGLLVKVDQVLLEAPRECQADERGYQPVERDAVFKIVLYLQDEFRRTGSVQKAVRRTAAFAQHRFETKKQDDFYSQIYRYKWADDFWDTASVPEPLSVRRRPWNRTREEWNSFVHRCNLGEKLEIRRSGYDSGIMESLLLHRRLLSPASMGAILCFCGLFACVLAFFFRPAGMRSPLLPGLLFTAALLLTGIRLRGRRRVWALLFLAALGSLLVTAALV